MLPSDSAPVSPQSAGRERHKRKVIAWMTGGTVACERCGYDAALQALQYHHRCELSDPRRRPSSDNSPLRHQSITPEKLTRWRREGFILCANCHVTVHSERLEAWIDDTDTAQEGHEKRHRPADNGAAKRCVTGNARVARGVS